MLTNRGAAGIIPLFAERHLARWCSRLARQPVTLEVDGSSPFRVAKTPFRKGWRFLLLCNRTRKAGPSKQSGGLFARPCLRRSEASSFRVAKAFLFGERLFLFAERGHDPALHTWDKSLPATPVVGFAVLSTSILHFVMIKYQSVHFGGLRTHIGVVCLCVAYSGALPWVKIHKKSLKKAVFSLVLSLTIMENNTILFRVGRVIQC